LAEDPRLAQEVGEEVVSFIVSEPRLRLVDDPSNESLDVLHV